MKRCAIWLTVLVVIVALTSAATAAVPRLINYQGALSDARGVAVDGIHTVTFSFYSSTDAGAPALWREVHRSIDVKDGLFHVVLGSVNPIPDKTFASGQLWIGISVDNDPEIEPRMQMTAVPWAVRAAVADALAGDSGSGPAQMMAPSPPARAVRGWKPRADSPPRLRARSKSCRRYHWHRDSRAPVVTDSKPGERHRGRARACCPTHR